MGGDRSGMTDTLRTLGVGVSGEWGGAMVMGWCTGSAVSACVHVRICDVYVRAARRLRIRETHFLEGRNQSSVRFFFFFCPGAQSHFRTSGPSWSRSCYQGNKNERVRVFFPNSDLSKVVHRFPLGGTFVCFSFGQGFSSWIFRRNRTSFTRTQSTKTLAHTRPLLEATGGGHRAKDSSYLLVIT